MAGQFIILEKVGNGYSIVDTGDRPDKGFFYHVVDSTITLNDNTLIIETGWNCNEITPLAANARLVVPTSVGPGAPSATGMIRGVQFGCINDEWVVIVDYIGADPMFDHLLVSASGGRAAQVSRSNVSNN